MLLVCRLPGWITPDARGQLEASKSHALEAFPMHIVETLFPELQPDCRTRVYQGLGDCRTRVKIGLTGRAVARRGGEMHFTELCSESGDRLLEQRYHGKYAQERIGRTEWFWLSDRLLLDLIVACVQAGNIKGTETLRAIVMERLQRQAAA
jgi:hypothetical protein